MSNKQQFEELLRSAREAEAAGDYPSAIAAAQKVVDLAQATRDNGNEAAGHLWWGRTLWRQGDYDAAQSQLEQALTLAQAAEERQIEADSLRNLGLVSWNLNDYATARTHFGQSLNIAREIDDRWGEGWTLNNLGLIFSEQGDYARGRAYFETALRVFQEIGEQRGRSVALGNLGWILDILGDYHEARTYMEQSLRACREIGDRDGEARTQSNLGLLLHHLGNDQAAWEYSHQSLLKAQEIGSRRQQAYSLTNVGLALTGLGRLEEAADAYQQAINIRQALGQSNLAIESLAGLARVCLLQNDLAQAQTHVEEILSHLETHTLDGTDEPVRVYFTCYCILRANQDPRAEAILNMAHRLLQKLASGIRNEEMRHFFLKNVVVHSQVLQIVRGFAESTFTADIETRKGDERKTKAQLVGELTEARRRIAELEMVAGELGYIEKTMGERGERFRSIAETASDAIILLDTYESIFFWNQAAQEIFGYQAHEARGQLLVSIVSREAHARLQKEMEQAIKTGASELVGKAIEAIGIRKDGNEFPLELSFATWKTEHEFFFTVICRDITERKRSQARLERRTVQLQAVTEVSRAVIQIRDLDQLLSQVTQLISRHFGFYHVGVFLVDEVGRYAVLRAANSEGGQRMLARHHKLGVGSEGIVGYVSNTGQARIALDVGEDAVHFKNPDLPDTRSEMAVPLRVGDEIIGALDVQSTAEAAFVEEDVTALTALADQVSIAIQNARLFQQTQEALGEAEQAQQRYVQQEWSQFIQERTALAHEYTLSGVPPTGDAPLPELEEAQRKGQLVIVGGDGVPGYQDGHDGALARAALAAPIKFRDQVVGVLDLQETETDRVWTNEEIALVEAVADQLGQALESARLFEETQRRAQREQATRQITDRIRSRTEVDDMLQTAVRELAQALGAPRVFVRLAPEVLERETDEPTN